MKQLVLSHPDHEAVAVDYSVEQILNGNQVELKVSEFVSKTDADGSPSIFILDQDVIENWFNRPLLPFPFEGYYRS